MANTILNNTYSNGSEGSAEAGFNRHMDCTTNMGDLFCRKADPSPMDVEKIQIVWNAMYDDSDNSSEGRMSDTATPLLDDPTKSNVNWHKRDSNGNSIAHKAAWYGDLRALHTLRKIDPNLIRSLNSQGFSPIFLADIGGHGHVVRYLELAIPEYRELGGQPPLSEKQLESKLESMCEMETYRIQRALTNSGALSLKPQHLSQSIEADLMSTEQVLAMMDTNI